MKKLINDPDDLVIEALTAMAQAHPTVLLDESNRVVLRAVAPTRGKVGLVSGGGAGHEPLHAGFVGRGMLDAACVGEVFTSPTPQQILAATAAVDTGAGVLYIVKNYTGDVMNFEMAAELAEAVTGCEVASVLIDDDVAVMDSLHTAGRRGVGATLVVEKIVGAAAERGWSLPELIELGCAVNANSRSFGIGLTSCTVPAAGRPTFELPDHEIEIGIGIHGEPGRGRVRLAETWKLAETLVMPVLVDLPFIPGDSVICFVNSMGGTPLIELYALFHGIVRALESRGIAVARSLVGPYVTALDMAGCSLTLTRADAEILHLWDAPVRTPALNWGA
ncbi:dihydroxyacetone kinase subunit DhaK [Nocardia grenadensis]|uniref:dihydroxyacetone kinase subunit DhaK n=1 Tax=Nocardia grenadensis TaxID=931537 RepID=UPI003D756C66